MIHLNHSKLHPLGFIYHGMFTPSKREKGTFIKKQGNNFLYINSSHFPQTIGVFQLTAKEMKDYQKDNATLVAPGFCAPSKGHRYEITRFVTIHTGEVRSPKHFLELLKKAEEVPELESDKVPDPTKVKDAGLAKNVLGKMKDVQFMTAKEKAKVARDWELFILKRLSFSAADTQQGDYGTHYKHLTKALYNHMHGHMGYIAHGSAGGFFSAQFEETADFLRNVHAIANNAGCGDVRGYRLVPGMGANVDYEDLFEVMIKVAKHYLPTVRALYEEESQEAHRRRVVSAQQLLQSEGFAVTKS